MYPSKIKKLIKRKEDKRFRKQCNLTKRLEKKSHRIIAVPRPREQTVQTDARELRSLDEKEWEVFVDYKIM